MNNFKRYKTHLFGTDGTVIGTRGKKLNSKTKSGYGHCYVLGESVYFHKKIYELFVGKVPKDFVVNHIDGNKQNNRPSNLEAVSKSEDIKHAYKSGLRSSLKKLDTLDIITIRMFRGDLGNRIMAKMFNVSEGTLSDAFHGNNNYANTSL